MSGAAGPVVRGRQGPRKPAGNLYPVKEFCACVDGAGRPRPQESPDGECMKCGHVVRRGERWT